jgi:hypothetical protein
MPSGSDPAALAELEAKLGTPSSNDEDAVVVRLALSFALGGGSGAGVLLADGAARWASVSGVVLIMLVSLLRMVRGSTRWIGSSPRSRRDHRESANDKQKAVYRAYRELMSEAYAGWASGAFKDNEKSKVARDNLLDTVLQAGTRLLQYESDSEVALIVVKETPGTWRARRKSQSDLVARIRRGMEWSRNTSLAEVMEQFAAHVYVSHFSACDRHYYLVAISDGPISDEAETTIEAIAWHYQSSYQFFRLVGVLEPPVTIVGKTSEE